MNNAAGTGQVVVRVELSDAFAELAADPDQITTLRGAVEEVVAALATGLGLDDAWFAVEVLSMSRPRLGGAALPRVRVEEQWCRVSDHAVMRAYAYARGNVLAPAADGEITAWLLSCAATGNGADGFRALAQFVAAIAFAAVRRNPGVLLTGRAAAMLHGRLATAAELNRAPAGQPQRAANAVARVLRAVLALAVPLHDLGERPELLAKLFDPDTSESDAAEELVAELRPAKAEIHLASADLRRLTLAADANGRDTLKMLRDGLFYESGLRLPTLQFVEDDRLSPATFAFKINGVLGLPWVGLHPEQQLVNDSPSGVAEAATTVAAGEGRRIDSAANPLNGAAFAVASPPLPSAVVSKKGYMIWSPFEYLALCLSVELRQVAPSLLDRACLELELERLDNAYPALVRGIRARYSTPQLVEVLRTLLADDVSLRDLRRVFGSLLDFDAIVTDADEYIVVDERLPVDRPLSAAAPVPTPYLVAAVRMSLRRYLTHKVNAGGASLYVYLVAPELESEIRRRQRSGTLLVDSGWVDALLDAVRSEAGGWGGGGTPPSLLTTSGLRGALRTLAAEELPHLPVLAYQDLVPDVNITPLGRISLGA